MVAAGAVPCLASFAPTHIAQAKPLHVPSTPVGAMCGRGQMRVSSGLGLRSRMLLAKRRRINASR